MRHPTAVLAFVATGVAAGIVGVAPGGTPVGAAPHAHVSLRPAHTVYRANEQQTYRYHATGLRKGTRLVLEDFEGTWETRATSGTEHGTVDGTFRIAGPVGPSRSAFRVVAMRHGTIYARSSQKQVYVYGRVGLSALCTGVLHKSLEAHGNTCGKGTADAGHGETFHYVMTTGESTPERGYTPQFGAAGTSCRSITLRFASDDGGPTTLELHQHGAKPRSHASDGGVGTFSTDLTGQAFGVSVSSEDNDLFTEFNGSASCYSFDGRR